MNEMEILSELKSALEQVSADDNPNGSVAMKISSVREMIKILEKREPKPITITTNEYGTEFYHCPNCNRLFFGPFDSYKDYCYRCGQALEWASVVEKGIKTSLALLARKGTRKGTRT